MNREFIFNTSSNLVRHLLLSKFFLILYHQFAFSYDFIAWLVSLGLWKRWVLSVQEFLRGPKILEIGHGPGHLYLSARKMGLQIYGLEESWSMLRLAKNNLGLAGRELKSTRGYAQSLPYQSNLFNQVVSTFPSNYIVDPMTLSEIHRVLAPGGLFIILPVAWITGKQWFHRLASWLFRITGQTPENNSFFEEKWIKVFTDAGFQARYEYMDLGTSMTFIVIAAK